MTKNKSVYVALRMTEGDLENLEYLRRRDETRSAAIRRIIFDAWWEAAKAQDEEAGHPSISDRWNCL